MIFVKAGMVIVCVFRDGYCVEAYFMHEESDALGRPSELSEAEITTLIAANGMGNQWKKRDVIAAHDQWETLNGAVLAVQDTSANQLQFITAGELKRQQDENAAKDKSKLKDF